MTKFVLIGPKCTPWVHLAVLVLDFWLIFPCSDGCPGPIMKRAWNVKYLSQHMLCQGFREYLMRNQRIKQYAIYTLFYLCESYLKWASRPKSPFQLPLGPVLRNKLPKLPRGPLEIIGNRHWGCVECAISGMRSCGSEWLGPFCPPNHWSGCDWMQAVLLGFCEASDLRETLAAAFFIRGFSTGTWFRGLLLVVCRMGELSSWSGRLWGVLRAACRIGCPSFWSGQLWGVLRTACRIG